MSQRLATLLTDLERIDRLDSQQRVELTRGCSWVRQATTEEIRELLTALRQLPSCPVDPDAQRPLNAVLGHVGMRLRAVAGPSTEQHLWTQFRAELAALYRQLGEQSEGRYHLLAALAASGGELDLVEFAELVVSDPPGQGSLAVLAFAPLFQDSGEAIAALFPRLLDGVCHPSVASPILDLANFATRQKLLPRHPAADRAAALATLLGELVQRLGVLERQLQRGGLGEDQLAANQDKVGESLALTVSLCDALALIGDRSVTGKLYQALELGHRHVRTEAASALARLGEQAGSEALVAMAAEPVVRLRVLAYAEEVGALDKIAEEFRSPVARAEAELVLWLADRAQFGATPQQVDLIDSRRQFWPGYDEPVDCCLFRYVYRVPHGEFSNVGIAGPLVYGFAADLTGLPVEDVYAAFAGWHAEHEQISEFEVEALAGEHVPQARVLRERVASEGYDSLQVRHYGMFFGQLVLVASAVYHGVFGTVIADAAQSHWWPQAAGPGALGPEDAYNVYKGRNLLAAFNPG